MLTNRVFSAGSLVHSFCVLNLVYTTTLSMLIITCFRRLAHPGHWGRFGVWAPSLTRYFVATKANLFPGQRFCLPGHVPTHFMLEQVYCLNLQFGQSIMHLNYLHSTILGERENCLCTSFDSCSWLK